jgi:hypothetical protein
MHSLDAITARVYMPKGLSHRAMAKKLKSHPGMSRITPVTVQFAEFTRGHNCGKPFSEASELVSARRRLPLRDYCVAHFYA